MSYFIEIIFLTLAAVGGVSYVFYDSDNRMFRELEKKRIKDIKDAMNIITKDSFIFKEDKRKQFVYKERDTRIVIEENSRDESLKVSIYFRSELIEMKLTGNVVIYNSENKKFLIQLQKDKQYPTDLAKWMLKVKEKWERREYKTEEEHNWFEETQIVVNNLYQKMEQEKEINEIKKTPIFGEVLKEMYLLRKEKVYLTEEEYHKINKTYPHDLNELKMMYISLDEKEKLEIKEKVERSLESVSKELEEMKKNIRMRKLGQVETKLEVIKTRAEVR